MKKRFLAMLLAVVMAFSLLPVTAFAASASGSCGANVRWSYSNGTLTIQGTGKMADYDPISMIDTPWYGYHEQIHTVKIGNGVTAIGDFAFSDCVNLTSVFIPGNVTSIGDGAFDGCKSLTSVAIPGRVASIGIGAFNGCESLTNVSIPGKVTSIGAEAFGNCFSLTDINVASGNSAYSSIDGVLFNANQTLLHTYPAGKSDKSYSIPASVAAIGDSAFSDCVNLTSVTIPGNVKSIGEFAFSWCGGLTSVTIPNGITTIKDWTFLGCSNLTSVTIPNSVTSIGSYAFSRCESLTNVTIPNSVTTIGESAFQRCTGLTSATIPGSVKSFGAWAFQGCSSLSSVTISNGVISIPMGLFSQCSGLTSVTIPISVTGVVKMAFNGCDSLKDVYYGGSESQWGQIAISFMNNSLTNATIHYNSAMPTTPTEPTTPTFTDVPAGEWYADPVAWAVQNEITNGYGAKDKFAPGVDCTEAQILTFLYRAAGEPSAAKSPVSVTDSYQDAINWAYEKGMIDRNFKENTPCTRATAVKYIWQAFDKPKAEKASSFTDVDKGADYAEAVSWAVEKDITNGHGGNDTFAPDKVCDRGTIVTFLYRAYKEN